MLELLFLLSIEIEKKMLVKTIKYASKYSLTVELGGGTKNMRGRIVEKLGAGSFHHEFILR